MANNPNQYDLSTLGANLEGQGAKGASQHDLSVLGATEEKSQQPQGEYTFITRQILKGGAPGRMLLGVMQGTADVLQRALQSGASDIGLQRFAQLMKSRREAEVPVPGIAAGTGRVLGTLAPFIAGTPEAMFEKGATLAGKLGLAGARAGLGALGMASQMPEHQARGALIGAISSPVAEAAGAGLGMLGEAPKLLLGKLGGAVRKAYETQKNISSGLYSKVFRGVGERPPLLGPETSSSLSKLKDAYARKPSVVAQSLETYQKNPGVEGLHQFRSDLGDEVRRIAGRREKSSTDAMRLKILSGTKKTTGLIERLNNDIRSNLSKVSTEKAAQYDTAQAHYAKNVVPFKEYSSVRKAIGEKPTFDPLLYKHLSTHAEGAKTLRRLTGISPTTLGIGRSLHARVLGMPLPAYLLAGAGGIYAARHKLGELL